MEYRSLGNSGLKVSALALGTMTFGSKFFSIAVVDQSLANAMVEKALEAGVNFFDTANVYSFGEAETMLGKALKAAKVPREKVVLATKVRSAMSKLARAGTGDVNNVGLSRKHIRESCEASLKRLQTDYIDLYQVHGWDFISPMEETMEALNDLVRQGKVLYLGCSNWTARHLAKALTLSRSRGWAPFVSLQAYYSLVGRDIEHELLPLCREEGLGLLPWSPLAGGFLTGKYHKNKENPKDGRRTKFDFPPLDKEKGNAAVKALSRIAQEKGATIAQIALSWCLAQEGVSAVILGAKTIAQLEENLNTLQYPLAAKDQESLSRITQPPELYPTWMMHLQNQGR